MKIELPFPVNTLSPNDRSHWAVKASVKKKYRRDCFLATKKHGMPEIPTDHKIPISLTFHPPGNYRYDEDNLIARMKSGLDGVADALEVDDVRFKILPPTIADAVKGGKVILELGLYPPSSTVETRRSDEQRGGY